MGSGAHLAFFPALNSQTLCPTDTLCSIDSNEGLLANAEVFEILLQRGCAQPPTAGSRALPSERQVFEYLRDTAGTTVSSKETFDTFKKQTKDMNLSREEILSLVNTRPKYAVEAYVCLENAEDRFTPEELETMCQLVQELFDKERAM